MKKQKMGIVKGVDNVLRTILEYTVNLLTIKIKTVRTDGYEKL